MVLKDILTYGIAPEVKATVRPMVMSVIEDQAKLARIKTQVLDEFLQPARNVWPEITLAELPSRYQRKLPDYYRFAFNNWSGRLHSQRAYEVRFGRYAVNEDWDKPFGQIDYEVAQTRAMAPIPTEPRSELMQKLSPHEYYALIDVACEVSGIDMEEVVRLNGDGRLPVDMVGLCNLTTSLNPNLDPYTILLAVGFKRKPDLYS